MGAFAQSCYVDTMMNGTNTERSNSFSNNSNLAFMIDHTKQSDSLRNHQSPYKTNLSVFTMAGAHHVVDTLT